MASQRTRVVARSFPNSVGSMRLGVGTMQWGNTWMDKMMNQGGNIPDERLDAFLRVLIKNGVRFFDSAEGYGGGSSELRLSRVIPIAKEEGVDPQSLVLATKFIPTLWRFTRHSLVYAAKQSRDRLGVDRIPLYFIHTPMHPLPLEHWVHAAFDAVDEGIIEEVGLSNCNAEQVRRAVAVANERGGAIVANQIMFNMLDWQSPALQATSKACDELGVTIVAYSPVGQGLLTSDLTKDKCSGNRAARMTGVKYEDLGGLRNRVESIAQARGKTMAQVCLNWVKSHGAVPLVGVRKVEHALDNTGAMDWDLTESERQALDEVSLSRSTLEKPRGRRMFFVVLISILILVYRVSALVETIILRSSSRLTKPKSKKER